MFVIGGEEGARLRRSKGGLAREAFRSCFLAHEKYDQVATSSFVSVSVTAGIKPHDEGLYILGSQEHCIWKVYTF